MAEDRWYSRARPLLELIAELEGTVDYINVGDLADRTGIPPMDVAVELDRLIGSGYVDGKVQKVMSGGNARPWHLIPVRLTGLGARTIGVWPSEDPYEALVGLIDRRLVEEPDEEKKSRLRRLRAALGDIGKGAASGLLAELLKRGL